MLAAAASAADRRWHIRPELRTQFPLSYELPPDIQASYSVRWPARLQWQPAEGFVQHIREGIREFVPLKFADIPQPYAGIVMFEFVAGTKTHPVAIDYSDYMDRVEEHARAEAALYLKMQYRTGGYSETGSAAILPGGYSTLNKRAYSYFGPARRRSEEPRKQHDVFGRFGMQFAPGLRGKAVQILRDQKLFRYAGGGTRTRYVQHLFDAAAARVCIDLPGNGPFCFRLIDYLAVGACIVAVRHRTAFPAPLVPGVHIAYVQDDLSDMVDVCRHYLENAPARQAMQRQTREYFDRFLHKRQLAAYYLSKCCHHIDGWRG
jgi:hypothetical protein